MSSELDEIIMGMGEGSRHRARKKGRKKERPPIIRRMTLELTQEKNEIIKQHLFNRHKKFAWEAIYDALALLAEKEGYSLAEKQDI